MQYQDIVTAVDQSLPQVPPVRPGGSLLMMVGLPGSGKSSIVRRVQGLLACTVVSTDWVRLQGWARPTYSLDEIDQVYEVCYEVIERRLRRGERVVFDASNYLAERRQRLFHIARRQAAPLAICHVKASTSVIRQRLQQRSRGQSREENFSNADWTVYCWMLAGQEPLQQDHFAVDTTLTPAELLAQQLRDYWLKIEYYAASDADLQSPGWAV